MKLFQLVALVGSVASVVYAQQYPSSSGALGGAFGSAASAATTPKPVFPPAQVHYVNIGEDLTGDYKFGYDTGKNGGGQSFREESRLPDGTVKGAYGYVDSEGKQRIVKYTAGIDGFKVESDEAAPGSGAAPAAAPSPRTYSPPAPQPAPVRTYTPPAPQQAPVRAYSPQPAYPVPQPQAPSSQALGGYTPVTPSVQRFAPPPPQQPAVHAAPAPTPISTTYRAPSPLPNYSAALNAQLAQSGASVASGAYRAQPISASLPSYSATLAQRQPTLSQASLRPAHLASVPRSQQPSLSSFGSQFNTEPQESTTWGPPVINKELLSYNIGIQG